MFDHDDTLVEIEGNEDEATPLLLNSTNERHRPYSTIREQQEYSNRYLTNIHDGITQLTSNHAVTDRRISSLSQLQHDLAKKQDDMANLQQDIARRQGQLNIHYEAINNEKPKNESILASLENVSRRDSTSTNISYIKPSNKRPIPSDIKFGGNHDEDVSTFLKKFNRYSDYVHLNERDKCDLLPLIITSRATFWYDGLTEDTRTSWSSLSQALTDKFGPKSKGFTQMNSVYEMKQGTMEPVDTYSYGLQSVMTLSGISDDKEKCRIFIRGLRPSIRAHVLDKEILNFDQAENHARNGEMLERIRKSDNSLPLVSVNAMEMNTCKDKPHQPPRDSYSELLDEIRNMRRMISGIKLDNSSYNIGSRSPARYQSDTSRTHFGKVKCSVCSGSHYTNQCWRNRPANNYRYNSPQGPRRNHGYSQGAHHNGNNDARTFNDQRDNQSIRPHPNTTRAGN